MKLDTKPKPDKSLITQADRDSFIKVCQNETPEVLWGVFSEFCWHDRQNEPEIKEMVRQMILWAENRKNNIPCCG